jgi:hypothetical protein
VEGGSIKVLALKLRHELHNNQGNNKDRQDIDKTACVRDAGKDGLAEETKQPLRGQQQDYQ